MSGRPSGWSAADEAPTERDFAGNLLGALALAVTDRMHAGTTRASRHGGLAAAALVSIHWFPGRPIGYLAQRLGVSHPGAVQIVDRLAADALVRRTGGKGRTQLLGLTPAGDATARTVLAERRAVLGGALAVLDDAQLSALVGSLTPVLAALVEGPEAGERVCRLCDEAACPEERCPVERLPIEPAAIG